MGGKDPDSGPEAEEEGDDKKLKFKVSQKPRSNHTHLFQWYTLVRLGHMGDKVSTGPSPPPIVSLILREFNITWMNKRWSTTAQVTFLVGNTNRNKLFKAHCYLFAGYAVVVTCTDWLRRVTFGAL